MKFNKALVHSLALCLLFKSQVSLAQFDPAILNQSTVKILVKYKGKIVSVATGFVWQKNNTIVTSLHVMYDQPGAIIIVEFNKRKRKAHIKSVIAGADLVLLEVKNPIAGWLAIKKYNKTKPKYKAQVSALGFNRGSLGLSTRELIKGYVNPEILKVLLPPDALAKLKASNVLDLNLPIYYLDGSLLPGYSGSPIVDHQGSLIGIGDGGLENGASGVSWVIPAFHLDKFNFSTGTKLPKGLSLAHSAFSADVSPASKTMATLSPPKMKSKPDKLPRSSFNNLLHNKYSQLHAVRPLSSFANVNSWSSLVNIRRLANGVDSAISLLMGFKNPRIFYDAPSSFWPRIAAGIQSPFTRKVNTDRVQGSLSSVNHKHDELWYPQQVEPKEVVYGDFTFIKTKSRHYHQMLASSRDPNGLQKVFDLYKYFFHGYRLGFEDYLFDVYEDGKMGLNIVVPTDVELKVTEDNFLLLEGAMFCRTCPYEIQYHVRNLAQNLKDEIQENPTDFLNQAANNHWDELNDEGEYGEYSDFRNVSNYGNERYVLRAAFSDLAASYQDNFEVNYFTAATNSKTWFQVQGILNRFDHDFLNNLDEHRGTDCRLKDLSQSKIALCKDAESMLKILMAVHLTSFSNELMLIKSRK